MHRDAFTALLARREALEIQHAAWCDAINLDGEDTAYTRGRRDATYAELADVQEQIESELEDERAAETTTEEEGI